MLMNKMSALRIQNQETGNFPEDNSECVLNDTAGCWVKVRPLSVTLGQH